MYEVLTILNIAITCFISFLFVYKIILGVFGLFYKKRFPDTDNEHSFAVLIAGRNEEKVIGNLISSIKNQSYNQDKIKIFIVADNCTDNTFTMANDAGKELGAETFVFERFDNTKVGKGYALDFLLENIHKTLPEYNPDAFLVFDADNLLDVNYVKEMNKVYDAGYKISTSYRNSKNFDSNWISATTSMSFLRECRFIHTPRAMLNSSTFISGTGFMVSSDVLSFENGWKYTTLTEDIEFSTSNIVKGNVCTYCDDAIFYDEQPTKFKDSWNQRMRWQKGFYQCFAKYFPSLIKTFFSKHCFANYEMMLMLFPFTVILFSWGAFYTIYDLIYSLTISIDVFVSHLLGFVVVLAVFYSLLVIYGSIILIRERKRCKTTLLKSVGYALAFPLFIYSYIPIAYVCLFSKVKWKPIPHTDAKKIDELVAYSKNN